MKLVLLQTLCCAVLWVTVAPNHRGTLMYGLSQAGAQRPPLKSDQANVLLSTTFTVAILPPTDDNFHLGEASENLHPCMNNRKNNAYNIFKRRHVRSDIPRTRNRQVWMRFLRNHNLCNRFTQSFLRYRDKSRIKNVCTRNGGKIHDRNLCISNEKFSFITVRIHNNCNIRKITKETKHIILACDKIDNVCRPVHFQRNPGNLKPRHGAWPCYYHPPASGAL